MKITRLALILLLGILLVSGVACGIGSGPAPTYELHTDVDGQGSVSPSSGTFSEGNAVTLTASPASGWRFDHWGGDASGSQQSITMTMNYNKTVTAYFTKIQYSLSTSVSPSASGSISPIGGTFDAGTKVTLTATPASGWRFDHWSGGAYGTSNTVTMTMDSSKSATAHFVPPSIRVTIDKIHAITDSEPFFMAPGDFYLVVAVTDGLTSSQVRIPSTGNYPLYDGDTVNINRVCFSTPQAGDYLQILVVVFEQDSGICYGQYAVYALPFVVDMLVPGLGEGASLLLSIIEQQRGDEGFWCDKDDFAGSYENTWYQSQNYGIRSHYVSGPPYMNIWFTIEEW